jgi:hypothetical protein
MRTALVTSHIPVPQPADPIPWHQRRPLPLRFPRAIFTARAANIEWWCVRLIEMSDFLFITYLLFVAPETHLRQMSSVVSGDDELIE